MQTLKCHFCSRTEHVYDWCSPHHQLNQAGWDWWEDMELFDQPISDGPDDVTYRTQSARLHGICPTCQKGNQPE